MATAVTFTEIHEDLLISTNINELSHDVRLCNLAKKLDQNTQQLRRLRALLENQKQKIDTILEIMTQILNRFK